MRRGPAVILLLTMLIASGYGARRAALEGWTRVTRFSPAHFQAARPTAGSPPLAGRLVLVLVDGLRPEDAARLPALDWLSRQGARFRLTSPAPAFPGPLAATILTGAPPVVHGYLLPPERPVTIDSLPAAAARTQIATGGAGGHALGRLVGATPASWAPVETPEALLAQAKSLLAANGPRLVILQVDQFHQANQLAWTAGPDSPAYKDLLGDLDATLVQLLQAVDLKTTALIVTGTVPTDRYGNRPFGGDLPCILAGPGVVPGKTGTGSLMDIAPTGAALLGTPTPLQNQGRPLAEALATEGRSEDVIAQRWLDSRRLYADAVLQTFGAEAAPDAPANAREASGYLADLEKRISEAQFAYWKRIVPPRLPYLGGVAGVLLLYLIVVMFQRFGGPVYAGALLYAVTFHGIFLATGGRYSADMAGLETAGWPIIFHTGLKIGAAMVVAGLVTGINAARRNFKKSSYLTMVSLHLALTTIALVALPMVVGLAFVLLDFPVQLPAPGLLVWFFLSALQVMVIGFLSPVWAFVAVTATRLTQRIWPVRETQPSAPTGSRPKASRRKLDHPAAPSRHTPPR